MAELSIRDLISKARQTPAKKPLPKKKRRRTGKKEKQTKGVMERFIDLHVTSKLYNTPKFNTLSINVHGFVPSNRVFNDMVVHPCMDELTQGVGIRDDTHLIIDLRTLFFVSHTTCQTILYQHLPWLDQRFDRVCVILPTNEKASCIVVKAFSSLNLKLPQLEMKVVQRARDAQVFLDRDKY